MTMRVMHIDRQRGWGGQLNRTIGDVAGLRSRGVDVVYVAHTGSPSIEMARKRGIEPVIVPLYGASLYTSALMIRKMAGWRRFDIVNCHGARDQLVATMLRLTGGCRRLVRTRHSSLPLRSGVFSRLQYVPVDAVVTVSEFLRQQAMTDGLPGEKIHTIHSSVDIERFRPAPLDPARRAEWGAQPGAVVFGHFARLGPPKGTDVLLDAFAKLCAMPGARPIHLLLVGARGEPYKERAAALGLSDRVTVLGHRDDVPALLPQVDVMVLPTLAEAMGTVLVEAGACGRPVIANNVGGVPEIINERTGILTPPKDTDALAAAMQRLADDEPLRRALGAAGQKQAEEHFSFDHMIDRTMALYEKLLKS